MRRQPRDLQDPDNLTVVAMLDILGARTRDVSTAQRLVEDILRISNDLRNGADRKRRLVVRMLPDTDFCHPETRVFGDTILLFWRMTHPSLVARVAYLMGEAFLEGLRRSVPLRGAIGVGQVADGGDLLLGPGVTDVAEWYGQAEALGIIATPRCGFVIEALGRELRPKGDRLSDYFVRAPTRLKGIEAAVPTWNVSWPAQLLGPGRPKALPQERNDVLEMLWRCEMPRGTEHKYLNTLEFFDWYVAAKRAELARPTSPP